MGETLIYEERPDWIATELILKKILKSVNIS